MGQLENAISISIVFISTKTFVNVKWCAYKKQGEWLSSRKGNQEIENVQ